MTKQTRSISDTQMNAQSEVRVTHTRNHKPLSEVKERGHLRTYLTSRQYGPTHATATNNNSKIRILRASAHFVMVRRGNAQVITPSKGPILQLLLV